MKKNRIYSLMETYQAITEDDLSEIAYVPSEGTDEKENQYWLNQAKLSVQRARNNNSSETGDVTPKFELSIEFPNEILNLFGDKYIVVVYSDETMSEIVFSTRYEIYKDGIRIMNTRSVPNVRGKGLALKIYKELKNKLNVPLYSDYSQSAFSRYGIWQKLYNESPDNINAYDTNTNDFFGVTMNGKGEMIYIDNQGEEKPVYTKKNNEILLVYR